MNPFNFDKIASEADFCGREVELARLMDLCVSKNNVALYGERRYGKTTLIHYLFEHVLPKHVLPIYVDIYNMVDEYDVALALYNAVIDALPFSLEQKLKQLPSLFQRVRVSAAPSRSGESITFRPELSDRSFDELVEDAINALSLVCQKHSLSHAVIAIDEFQQVANIKSVKIDAVLRKLSQQNAHVSFIFSGSKKNLLRNLLSHKNAPWFGMTTPIVLTGIDENALYAHCNNKLNGIITREAFASLYQQTKGQTRLILQVCARAYAERVDTVDMETVSRLLELVVVDYDDEFRAWFMGLPARQKNAITAVALNEKDGGIYAKPILSELRITKQTLQKALDALVASDDIVKIGEGHYQFSVVMMGLWAQLFLIKD